MQIRPLYDNVLAKRLEAETQTKSGIIIPDSAKEKHSQASVIAVGNGQVGDNGEVRPLQVKVGDRVLLKKYSGNEIKLNNEEFIIVRENEILAIIEG